MKEPVPQLPLKKQNAQSGAVRQSISKSKNLDQ